MENETPLRLIIGHNLADLRKLKGDTQTQLAERFGYSDKAVSKWEHGEAIPDIETLAKLADYYEVTLDFLTHEGTAKEKRQYLQETKIQRLNKNVITILACLIAPIVCVIIYIILSLLPRVDDNHWTLFLWWIPIDAIICFIFNCIWGPRKLQPLFSNIMIWSIITVSYLELGISLPNSIGWNLWMIFFIGVPLTVAAFLWTHIKHSHHN